MTAKTIKDEVGLDSHATSHDATVVSDPVSGATPHTSPSTDLSTFQSDLETALDTTSRSVDPWTDDDEFENKVFLAMTGLTLDGVDVGSALGEWQPLFMDRSQSSGTGWQGSNDFGQFKLWRNDQGTRIYYSDGGRFVFFGFELI